MYGVVGMAGFGETLRQARAHMGVSLKEAEQATRISRHHLAALEDENFEALPALTYQRGIVRSYSSYLQLDPGKLLAMFEDAHGGKLSPSHGVIDTSPINMPTHWTPNFAIISFALVLAAIISAWMYSAFIAPSDVEILPTVPVPTATAFSSDIPVPTLPPTQLPATEVPTATIEPAQENAGARSTTSTDGQSRRRGGDNQRHSDNSTQPSDTSEGLDTAPVDANPASNQSANVSDLTSIMVTAGEEIYVTVIADGVNVFEGKLAAGQSTRFLTGNRFEVTTSWGAQTIFTNACGGEFTMGYETGQVTYQLQKQPDSCPPIS